MLAIIMPNHIFTFVLLKSPTHLMKVWASPVTTFHSISFFHLETKLHIVDNAGSQASKET